jgi:hypothetical protein
VSLHNNANASRARAAIAACAASTAPVVLSDSPGL